MTDIRCPVCNEEIMTATWVEIKHTKETIYYELVGTGRRNPLQKLFARLREILIGRHRH